MKKNRYVYPAILHYSDDGITVNFPDIPGCFTCAATEEKAIERAKGALELNIYTMEKDGEDIPSPTQVKEIKVEKNQILMLIDVWMPLARASIENRAVNKTLTLPKWLNDMVKDSNINCSQLLQEALLDALGVNKKNT
jgi:predicted RNase H-like HicB family nuclease